MKNSVIKKLFWVIFILVVMLFFIINLNLFLRQARAPRDGSDGYFSDIHFYVDAIEGIDNGDDYTYPIFFALSKIASNYTSTSSAVALVAALLNSLSCLVLGAFFYCSLKNSIDKKSIYYLAVLLLPLVMMIVSMVFLPSKYELPGVTNRYMGIFTPNPWHNHTYFAARPMAIIAYLAYREIIKKYKENISVWLLGCFSLSLVLTTLTKPSFTLAFGSAAFLVWLFNLKKIRNTVMVGMAFLPTVAVLAYQYIWGPFGSHSSQGENAGIGFSVGYIWSLYCENIPLAIVLALFFPIVVMLFNTKELWKNVTYRFSVLFAMVSSLEFLVLYEKGTRFWHANFAWGYMYGIFFAILEAVILVLDNMINKKNNILVVSIEWLALLMHVVCGITYFLFIFKGGSYLTF